MLVWRYSNDDGIGPFQSNHHTSPFDLGDWGDYEKFPSMSKDFLVGYFHTWQPLICGCESFEILFDWFYVLFENPNFDEFKIRLIEPRKVVRSRSGRQIFFDKAFQRDREIIRFEGLEWEKAYEFAVGLTD